MSRIESPVVDALRSRIENKEARIGIVGLGYVGLPLAVEYAKRGFDTTGFDVWNKRVDQLNRGENFIDDVDDEELNSLVSEGRLRGTTDFNDARDIDVFFICVPTPMSPHKDPDVSHVREASRSIAGVLRKGQLVILKSTTFPNTTEGIIKPMLDATGLVVGEDYFLAYSPERVDPGNKEFHTGNTPVVVGGVTDTCRDLASLAIRQMVGIVHEVSSPKVGEMEKLLENIFRSVNIALVNELAKLCDRMGGINMWEVVEAAGTKPFGFMKFTPGPGVGGHCIPIDPYYLSWLARKYDFETSFITLAAKTNESMPFYVVSKIIEALASQPVATKDAQVVVLGATFKRDVADDRHSLAEPILGLLREKGLRHITLCDPMLDSYSYSWHNGHAETLETVPVTEELIKGSDIVVLITDHSRFDYQMIARNAACIVDTRNAFADVENRDNLILLGGGTIFGGK